MLVSVIIPCYNAERYINECINSVLQQTYRQLEVIVVDDGSTDNSSSLVKQITDPRVKYFYKKNGGHSSARNYGIEKSTGAYVAFLDSDDYWAADKIKKQLWQAQFYDVVYTDYNTVNASGQPVAKKVNIKVITDPAELKKTLLIKNVILGSGSGVLMNRKVVETVGAFNTTLKVGEDWDYWARTAWAGFTFGYVDESLVTIRYNEASTQSTSSNKVWKTSIETVLKSFLGFKDLTAGHRALVFKRLLSNSYFFGNSFREMATYFGKAIQNDSSVVLHRDSLLLMIKFYPRTFKRMLKF